MMFRRRYILHFRYTVAPSSPYPLCYFDLLAMPVIKPIFSTERLESESQALGFPGGAVVENMPANARHGFEPWSGKIPHAAEQLGP